MSTIIGLYHPTLDVVEFRAILRLIETGARIKAADAIDCLDTLVRDLIPTCLYDSVVPGD